MNFYEILEISKHSDTKSIKKHYYTLSKKYHPDKNNGISDEKFKLLSEAYSTLSNPKKRYLYDMKLLFNENFGKEFTLNFSDSELEILHDYYLRLSTSCEFRLFKLLFRNLPHKFKKKYNKHLNSKSLVSLKDFKYIDARHLNESFDIYLNRPLKDVYLNLSKELIISTKDHTYDIFITHSDYSLNIPLSNQNSLNININTILPEKYTLNGSDLYYNYKINIYEYYFKELFPITLPNDLSINLKNTQEFNNSVKIPYLGLKEIDKRGDLYIYKELDLTIINDKNHYREILKEIFT
tara:strand:- start:725 stop:1609 length:885 start_codon:yes stop_codon:yes gene_type:complete